MNHQNYFSNQVSRLLVIWLVGTSAKQGQVMTFLSVIFRYKRDLQVSHPILL